MWVFKSSIQIPHKLWSLWGEVMQTRFAIVNINSYCVVELIGVATLQNPLNIAWVTDLWVQLLVLCKVPEMSRTTDLRSVLKLVSVMCLFLCKCKSDEYIQNYVVLFKRINQVLKIISGNTCWSSDWMKWIFNVGFHSVTKKWAF